MLFCVASTVIDGCKKKNKECHSNAYCSSANKSYECLCETGYTGDGVNNCNGMNFDVFQILKKRYRVRVALFSTFLCIQTLMSVKHHHVISMRNAEIQMVLTNVHAD